MRWGASVGACAFLCIVLEWKLVLLPSERLPSGQEEEGANMIPHSFIIRPPSNQIPHFLLTIPSSSKSYLQASKFSDI